MDYFVSKCSDRNRKQTMAALATTEEMVSPRVRRDAGQYRTQRRDWHRWPSVPSTTPGKTGARLPMSSALPSGPCTFPGTQWVLINKCSLETSLWRPYGFMGNARDWGQRGLAPMAHPATNWWESPYPLFLVQCEHPNQPTLLVGYKNVEVGSP